MSVGALIREKFNCVPIWVWIFLAATQLLTLVSLQWTIPEHSHQVKRLKSIVAEKRFLAEHGYDDIIAMAESGLQRDRFDRIVSGILFPIFAILAVRTWVKNRKPISQGSSSLQDGHRE